MSNNISVVSSTKTLISSFAPAGTIAAFATTAFEKFSVETFGMVGSREGHVVRLAAGPAAGGTTVKFSEYADAVAGTPQELAGRLNGRVAPASREGGPNSPLNPAAVLVSATRQGVSGKKPRPVAGAK